MHCKQSWQGLKGSCATNPDRETALKFSTLICQGLLKWELAPISISALAARDTHAHQAAWQAVCSDLDQNAARAMQRRSLVQSKHDFPFRELLKSPTLSCSGRSGHGMAGTATCSGAFLWPGPWKSIGAKGARGWRLQCAGLASLEGVAVSAEIR